MRAITELLRIHRDTHIFQYVETVNAPPKGAGRRGPGGAIECGVSAIFYYAEVSHIIDQDMPELLDKDPQNAMCI